MRAPGRVGRHGRTMSGWIPGRQGPGPDHRRSSDEAFPRAVEKGELGRRLTALVQRGALDEVARAIGLGDHLVLAPADAAGGARTIRSCWGRVRALIRRPLPGRRLEVAHGFVARVGGALGRVADLPVELRPRSRNAQGAAEATRYRLVSAVGEAHSRCLRWKCPWKAWNGDCDGATSARPKRPRRDDPRTLGIPVPVHS